MPCQIVNLQVGLVESLGVVTDTSINLAYLRIELENFSTAGSASKVNPCNQQTVVVVKSLHYLGLDACIMHRKSFSASRSLRAFRTTLLISTLIRWSSRDLLQKVTQVQTQNRCVGLH